MVEKLSGTVLMPKNKSKNFSSRDSAISWLICSYLKQMQMHYTLSVFASECPTIKPNDSLEMVDLTTLICNLLGFNEHIKRIYSLEQKDKSLLECLIGAFVRISQRKLESKSSQFDGPTTRTIQDEPRKLLINSHTQTDEKINFTQSVQTGSLVRASTQTESEQLLSVISKEEFEKLQKQLHESNRALESCQCKLQDTKKRLEAFIGADEKIQVLNTTFDIKQHHHRPPIHLSKRIQEATSFLNNLDARLLYLDLKYQSLTNTDVFYPSAGAGRPV